MPEETQPYLNPFPIKASGCAEPVGEPSTRLRLRNKEQKTKSKRPVRLGFREVEFPVPLQLCLVSCFLCFVYLAFFVSEHRGTVATEEGKRVPYLVSSSALVGMGATVEITMDLVIGWAGRD